MCAVRRGQIWFLYNCAELLPMNYLVYHNWTTLYFIQEVTMLSWINCPYKLLKLKVQSLWKRYSLMGNVYMYSMITEQFKDENYHCTKGLLYTCLTNNTFKKNVWQNRYIKLSCIVLLNNLSYLSYIHDKGKSRGCIGPA